MLVFLLALPVLVLLFLYKFGNNKFKIPVYHAYDSTEVNGTYVITDAHHVPDFAFETNQGNILTNKELSNSVYVVDFFFTKCPSICKDMSSHLMRVQESFLDDNRVKILSFTVDPARDSVEVLNEYAKLYRAKKDKWYFLTGPKDSLYALAKTGFYLTALENQNSAEEFTHAPHFVLVDKQGRIRGYYNGTDKKEVDRLITEIKILLEEYDNK